MELEGEAESVARRRADDPLADLVKRLAELTARLVRQEVALARVDLAGKAKRTGLGAGLAAAGALLALFALGGVLAAAVVLIATGMEAWVAAVIVAGGVAGLAGLLALVGTIQVRRTTPPVPSGAIGTAREDLEALREGARRS